MGMPLEGIRIIEWAVWHAGPGCARMLADLGAEVIKIEDPAGGDPLRGYKSLRGVSMALPGDRTCAYEFNNRNKKSIVLDLKNERSLPIVRKLIERSDVFVHNFRNTVATSLHMDYQTLSQYNEKLIYATISGHGSRGPGRNVPAMDYVAQARSGMMTSIPESGLPPLVNGSSRVDQAASMVLVEGILAALLVRERLGIGQEVETSLLGSAICLMVADVAPSMMLGRSLPKGRRAEASNPLWNHYRCADDEWIALAHLQTDRYWPRICGILGLPALAIDTRFDTASRREENSLDLVAILDSAFAAKTRADWLDAMGQESDLIYAPVNDVFDLASDPDALANEYILDLDHEEMGHVKVVGLPVSFSKTPGAVGSAAPHLGEHTEEVLLDICDCTWDEIADLKASNVIM